MPENGRSPNIIQTIRDKDGRVIGFIADNSVESGSENIRRRLENIARIWKKALNREKKSSKGEDEL